MLRNKTVFSILFILIGVLAFVSCQKEEVVVKEPTVEEPIVEETTEVNFENQATSGIVVIKDILMTIFHQSLLKPELWGLQGEPSAETRDACPDTDNSTGSLPGTYNLVLDFAVGCVPATGSESVGIEGTITAVFTDNMFVDDRIDVTLTENFKIGDYSVTDADGGDIAIRLHLLGTGDGYRIRIDEDLTFTDVEGRKTIYSTDTDLGNFKLNDGGTVDVPSNPATYLDDQIRLNVKSVAIECLNVGEVAGTGETFVLESGTTAGGGADRLVIEAFNCGCIKNGSLDITGVSPVAAVNTLDFGYNTPDPLDGSQTNNGGCDSWARNTTTDTAEELDSCN